MAVARLELVRGRTVTENWICRPISTVEATDVGRAPRGRLYRRWRDGEDTGAVDISPEHNGPPSAAAG